MIDELNGIVVYVPETDFNGLDSMAYQVCDDDGACAQAWLFVTVLPRNDPPHVRRDTLVMERDAVAMIFTLANDDDLRDPGSSLDVTSLAIVEDPMYGSLDFVGSLLTYTPLPGFVGVDSFHYQVCDLGIPLPHQCGEAWFQITVQALAAPPKPGSLPSEAGPSNLSLPAGLLQNLDGHTWRESGIRTEMEQEVEEPAEQGLANLKLGTFKVYDEHGRLRFASDSYPLGGWLPRSKDLPKLPSGVYFFSWWEAPALNAWPQHRGPLVISR